jgi:serine/threonine protein phosphatase 1
MRVFVLTDIHGKNDLFRKALKQIGLKKADKLILLGDLIDRGKNSKGVLDTIFLLLESGFDITCLIGNHEQMFLDSFEDINKLNLWLMNGGDKTLSSFLTSSIEKIPPKYIKLLKSFKYYHEHEQYILVHAALNMKIENPYSDLKTLVWERDPFEYLDKNWLGKRTVVHGHNPTIKSSIEESINNNSPIISIDNGVYMVKEGYGSMCVLELTSKDLKFIK